MVKYILVDESNRKWSWRLLAALLILFLTSAALSLTFFSWNASYEETLQYSGFRNPETTLRLDIEDPVLRTVHAKLSVAGTSDEFRTVDEQQRLVCYYSAPNPNSNIQNLRLVDVKANLCTHINIGPADVVNGTILLSDELQQVLRDELPVLRTQDPALQVLLWIGGGSAGYGFPAMVRNHTTRKVFVRSVKETLHRYLLDGIDLDWEFPRAYNKERQHFSQLLYEIRQEYHRHQRDYLLTVAVCADVGIALFAYDISELNKYADYVNLMTYDYHFYARNSPFTGLNAPLYARGNEASILGTLNINYSVNWWLEQGLLPRKLVVGLPTYGHSFTLVNALNKAIGAPAEAYGHCGSKGFTTYSDICWFKSHNVAISTYYDQQSCSPYLSSGTEWISYENETSIECKARFVKSKNLGGIMAYSLNTDDFQNVCVGSLGRTRGSASKLNVTFPLLETVKRILRN